MSDSISTVAAAAEDLPSDLPIDVMEATNLGVPVAISVLVVMVLCLVIIVSKKRRREARREAYRRGVMHTNSMRPIRGGVALSKLILS